MDKQYLIIDCGSGYCKAGVSGDSAPLYVLPTVVGHPKCGNFVTTDDKSSLLFGQGALEKENEVNLIRPIQKGIIKEWDDLEFFLDNLFQNELKKKPENYGIFMTEPPATTRLSREKLTELLFETFNVPSFFITNGAVLSLYGACKFSGFVLDCGYDSTSVVPISDGYPFSSSIKSFDVGGKDISEYLLKLLNKKGHKENSIYNSIDYIKENYCYVTLNSKEESNNPKTYKLPDDTVVELNEEKYLAPEILFHPELINKGVGGIGNTFCSSMSAVDHFTKTKFDGNLVISGGSSLFEGFKERLASELKNYYGGKYKDRTNIISIKERRYLQWIGASIYSLMQIFKGLCTSRQEYDTYGPSVVHNKCFY